MLPVSEVWLKKYYQLANRLATAALLNKHGIKTGLLSMKNGEVIKTIVEAFSKTGIGYTVDKQVLKASDYGVPQSRERVIIIGYRNDLNIKPSFPTPTGITVTVDEAISDLPLIHACEGAEVLEYTMAPQNSYQRMMRANSKQCKNHAAMKHTQRLIQRFHAIKAGQSLVDVWEEHGSVKRGDPSQNVSGN